MKALILALAWLLAWTALCLAISGCASLSISSAPQTGLTIAGHEIPYFEIKLITLKW